MRKNIFYIIIFVLSLICLFISIRTFYNVSIYADEVNSSPSIILGGNFWLINNWIKIILLVCITLLTLGKIINKKSSVK